eukprot:618130_1
MRRRTFYKEIIHYLWSSLCVGSIHVVSIHVVSSNRDDCCCQCVVARSTKKSFIINSVVVCGHPSVWDQSMWPLDVWFQFCGHPSVWDSIHVASPLDVWFQFCGHPSVWDQSMWFQ